MDDLARWIGAQLGAEEAEARLTADAFGAVWTTDDAMESVGSDTGADVVSEPYAPRSFIAEHDPARVLREIEAKRGLLADIVAETHFRNEEDNWYTCAALTDEDGEPVCSDGSRAPGPCDCGRDAQVARRLLILALPYEGRPGYEEAIASAG